MASGVWESFWRGLWRFESEKIRPRIAIRNTLGVILPILIGSLFHQPALGLVGSLGALNVAYSDSDDPPRERGRRMLVASILIAIALAIGGITGRHNALATTVTTIWGFGAAMLVALGTTAGDLGTISLVTLVVFASRPLTPTEAAFSGVVALAGALLQTGLSLVFWRGRRYEQERTMLATIYGELARLQQSDVKVGTAPLASAAFIKAYDVLWRVQGPERERFQSLLSQAERVRLRLLTLGRLRRRIQRDPASAPAIIPLDDFATECSQALAEIADALLGTATVRPNAADLLQERVDRFRLLPWTNASAFFLALLRDAAAQMDALVGQVRAAGRLTRQGASAIPAVVRPALKTGGVARVQAMARWRNQVAILRANLSSRSVAFRHALRLAVCLAIGEIIGRAFDWQRSYWIPMTIAIVLKPDFLSTFTRGALRLAGTFVGLILATVLYHVFPASTLTDVIFVGTFTLALRWVGPANYGVFVIAVSGLIVALIANSGTAPNQVIPLRALNTAIGGILALAAYAAWPTWERTQTGEMFARLLDAYRAYTHGLKNALGHPAKVPDTDYIELDRLRQAARVARSNVEASAERIRLEPGSTGAMNSSVAAMLASSHDFIYAVMALEAVVGEPTEAAGLRAFLDQVELTLYALSAALRGSRLEQKDLPPLRQRYRELIEQPLGEGGRHSLVQVESDRMVNGLNTCAEQVLNWLRRK